MPNKGPKPEPLPLYVELYTKLKQMRVEYAQNKHDAWMPPAAMILAGDVPTLTAISPTVDKDKAFRALDIMASAHKPDRIAFAADTFMRCQTKTNPWPKPGELQEAHEQGATAQDDGLYEALSVVTAGPDDLIAVHSIRYTIHQRRVHWMPVTHMEGPLDIDAKRGVGGSIAEILMRILKAPALTEDPEFRNATKDFPQGDIIVREACKRACLLTLNQGHFTMLEGHELKRPRRPRR